MLELRNLPLPPTKPIQFNFCELNNNNHHYRTSNKEYFISLLNHHSLFPNSNSNSHGFFDLHQTLPHSFPNRFFLFLPFSQFQSPIPLLRLPPSSFPQKTTPLVFSLSVNRLFELLLLFLWNITSYYYMLIVIFLRFLFSLYFFHFSILMLSIVCFCWIYLLYFLLLSSTLCATWIFLYQSFPVVRMEFISCNNFWNCIYYYYIIWNWISTLLNWRCLLSVRPSSTAMSILLGWTLLPGTSQFCSRGY